jgi:hypothetical protein
MGVRLRVTDGARPTAKNGGSIHGSPPEGRSNETWFGFVPPVTCPLLESGVGQVSETRVGELGE